MRMKGDWWNIHLGFLNEVHVFFSGFFYGFVVFLFLPFPRRQRRRLSLRIAAAHGHQQFQAQNEQAPVALHEIAPHRGPRWRQQQPRPERGGEKVRPRVRLQGRRRRGDGPAALHGAGVWAEIRRNVPPGQWVALHDDQNARRHVGRHHQRWRSILMRESAIPCVPRDFVLYQVLSKTFVFVFHSLTILFVHQKLEEVCTLSIDRLIDWFNLPFVDRLIDLLIYSSFRWLIDWLIDLLIDWLID